MAFMSLVIEQIAQHCQSFRRRTLALLSDADRPPTAWLRLDSLIHLFYDLYIQ
jgi:hypothetical protein